MLRRLQNELFDAGSKLATPPQAEYPDMHRMSAVEVDQLEAEIDRMNEEPGKLASFTLPGVGQLNSALHVARTVCRRAERCCWRLKLTEPINQDLLKYFNRLSDHLFVQSRWEAKRLGEPGFLWDRGLRLATGPRRKPA